MATVKRIRPSGSIDGHQWPISRCAGSGVVSTTGVPPSPETIDRPASQVREKTMRSSAVQTAPGPLEAAQTTSGSPPLVETCRIWPSRKKPTQRAVRGHERPARRLRCLAEPGHRARRAGAGTARSLRQRAPRTRRSGRRRGSVTFGDRRHVRRRLDDEAHRRPGRRPLAAAPTRHATRPGQSPPARRATAPRRRATLASAAAPPSALARERLRSSSPSTRRASAACCRRLVGIALEAAPDQPPQLVGRVGAAGRDQSTSARSTAAIVSEVVSPSNGRRPVSIS